MINLTLFNEDLSNFDIAVYGFSTQKPHADEINSRMDSVLGISFLQ